MYQYVPYDESIAKAKLILNTEDRIMLQRSGEAEIVEANEHVAYFVERSFKIPTYIANDMFKLAQWIDALPYNGNYLYARTVRNTRVVDICTFYDNTLDAWHAAKESTGWIILLSSVYDPNIIRVRV